MCSATWQPKVERLPRTCDCPFRGLRVPNEMLLRADAIGLEGRNVLFLQFLVFPAAPPSQPLVIEPVVYVYKVDFAHLKYRDGSVYDPLSQREEGGIVVFGRNKLDHQITSPVMSPFPLPRWATHAWDAVGAMIRFAGRLPVPAL